MTRLRRERGYCLSRCLMWASTRPAAAATVCNVQRAGGAADATIYADPSRCAHAILIPALVLGVAIQLTATAHAQPADSNDYINPDRPGIADGSNVLGEGRFQIETGIQREYRSNDGHYSRTLFLPTLLRLGLDESFELRAESNTYIWMKATDSTQGPARTEGFAPVSVGLKYHFVDSLGWQQPSLGPSFASSHGREVATSG